MTLFQQIVRALQDLRIGMPAQPGIAELGARVAPHAIGHGAVADLLADRLGVSGQFQRLVGRAHGVDACLDIDVAEIDLTGAGLLAVFFQLLRVVLRNLLQVEA